MVLVQYVIEVKVVNSSKFIDGASDSYSIKEAKYNGNFCFIILKYYFEFYGVSVGDPI